MKLIMDWHCHHGLICEPRFYPRQERLKHFERKQLEEYPLRRRLYHRVRGKLPQPMLDAAAKYVEAWDAYDKAGDAYYKARNAYYKAWDACNKAGDAYGKAQAAYNKAQAAYNKAWDAYKKVLRDNMPAVERLHATECPDCPWDGETIFTRKNKKGIWQ